MHDDMLPGFTIEGRAFSLSSVDVKLTRRAQSDPIFFDLLAKLSSILVAFSVFYSTFFP